MGALAWVDYDLSSDKKLVSAGVLTEPMLLGWYPKMVKKSFYWSIGSVMHMYYTAIYVKAEAKKFFSADC